MIVRRLLDQPRAGDDGHPDRADPAARRVHRRAGGRVRPTRLACWSGGRQRPLRPSRLPSPPQARPDAPVADEPGREVAAATGLNVEAAERRWPGSTGLLAVAPELGNSDAVIVIARNGGRAGQRHQQARGLSVIAVPTSVGYGAALEGLTTAARDARLLRSQESPSSTSTPGYGAAMAAYRLAYSARTNAPRTPSGAREEEGPGPAAALSRQPRGLRDAQRRSPTPAGRRGQPQHGIHISRRS